MDGPRPQDPLVSRTGVPWRGPWSFVKMRPSQGPASGSGSSHWLVYSVSLRGAPVCSGRCAPEAPILGAAAQHGLDGGCGVGRGCPFPGVALSQKSDGCPPCVHTQLSPIHPQAGKPMTESTGLLHPLLWTQGPSRLAPPSDYSEAGQHRPGRGRAASAWWSTGHGYGQPDTGLPCWWSRSK